MPADALSSVGVVIVTYQSEATLDRTLEALPRQDVAAVVVVDNDSRDQSVAKARRHAGVHVEANAENVGFGAACNQGRLLLPASAKHVLFLNPDCVIERADLALLTRHLETTPRCGLVAPRLERGGAPLTSGGRLGAGWAEFRHVVPPRVSRLLPDRRFAPTHAPSGRVGYVEGACMLFRASAFDAISGFDPRYFLFYEEMDVARRLVEVGLEVHLLPGARAEHQVAASRRSDPARSSGEMWRSARLYLRRWHGRLPAALFSVLGRGLLLERRLRRRLDDETLRQRRDALSDRPRGAAHNPS